MKKKKGEGIYQNVENVYRKAFCDGKSRPLLNGEIHPFCANFEGPGTRIDLPEVRNYPPFNGVDSVAKVHDLEYEKAFKLPKGKERENKIREADDRFLRDIEKYRNEEPYYSIGKAGIGAKVLTEKIGLPILPKDYKGGCLVCYGGRLCNICKIRGGCFYG
jgi:hypothetical protein